MGLLVTSREDRQWNERERTEIEQIAQTLAIARLLDQRREWLSAEPTTAPDACATRFAG